MTIKFVSNRKKSSLYSAFRYCKTAGYIKINIYLILLETELVKNVKNVYVR